MVNDSKAHSGPREQPQVITKHPKVPALSTQHKASQGASTLNKVQSIPRCQHSQQSTITRKTFLQRPVVADIPSVVADIPSVVADIPSVVADIPSVSRTKQPEPLWREEDRERKDEVWRRTLVSENRQRRR